MILKSTCDVKNIMNIPVETQLDEILSCAYRLESKTPYTLNLTLPSVLHGARSVLNATSFLDTDIIDGQYLLGSKNRNIEKVPTILHEINTTKIVSDEVVSFSDRNTDNFRNAIVDSLLKVQENTEKTCDNFIMNFLENKWEHGLKSKYNGITVHNFNEFENKPYVKEFLDSKKDSKPNNTFTPQGQLYADNLLYIGPSYASHMAKCIRKEKDQTTLADIFSLISHIEKAKNHEKGALRFLEKQMRKHIEKEVNSNLKIAKRGGAYGIIPTIEAYARIQNHPKCRSEWATLYYALRCGVFQAALEYTQSLSVGFGTDIKSALQMLARGIKVTETVRARLAIQFQAEQNTQRYNPFKVLALSVLSGVGGSLEDESIIRCFEDSVWLHLWLPQTLDEFAEGVRGNLKADDVNEYMEGHSLLLVGRYKEAARWFLLHGGSDGFHVALAMHTSGLVGAEMIAGDVLEYAKEVFGANRVVGVRYISMLRERSTRVAYTARLAAEVDDGPAIFESDGFELKEAARLPAADDGRSARELRKAEFVPVPRADGSGVAGWSLRAGESLADYRPDDDDEDVVRAEGLSPAAAVLPRDELEEAIHEAGVIAKERSQYDTAIRLFEAAGDVNSVIEIACMRLRDCSDVSPDIIISTEKIFQQALECSAEVDGELLQTIEILLHIAHAFGNMRMRRYAQAATEVEATGLFPISEGQIESCKARITQAEPIVAKVIPGALGLIVEAYARIIEGMSINDPGRELMSLKANTLIQFSGELNIGNEEMARKLLSLSDMGK